MSDDLPMPESGEPKGTAAQTQPVPDARAGSGLSVRGWLMVAALQSVLTAAAMAGYDHLYGKPWRQYGVVDVQEIYRLKEKQLVEIASRPGVGEAEKGRVVEAAAQFAQQFPKALDELPNDCRCLVLVRTAIAAEVPGMRDLTPLLRRKLGV